MIEKWLRTNSLDYNKLTLKYLVSKSNSLRSETRNVSPKFCSGISFDLKELDDFQLSLQGTANILTEKMKDLTNGEFKQHGMIVGENVGLLVDLTIQNEQRESFVDSLKSLIKHQLSSKRKLYLASFCHVVKTLWDSPVCLCQSRIDEALEWIEALKFYEGSDLLGGMKIMFNLKDIQTLCVVVCSRPDTGMDVICEYVEQKNLWTNFNFHLISYECSDQSTNNGLKLMAENNGGCYHCFNTKHKSLSYESTELRPLLDEIKKCESLFKILRQIRMGWLGTTRVEITKNGPKHVLSSLVDGSSTKPHLNVPPLHLQMPPFKQSTSQEWILRNGLKAKQLDLYQILAGNSHPYKEQFVPIIGKKVQSQVNERAMTQFVWKDGSIRNIHVDVLELLKYQQCLGCSMALFEKRLDWLRSGSRRLFGSVTEDNVVLLLDFSSPNTNLLPHIQKSLRMLMQEQLANKRLFNIVVCSDEIYAWKPAMVAPTGERLQEAWRWLMSQKCCGGRNFMAGLRCVLENEEELKHNIKVEGLYLFATGMPDHSMDVFVSYTEERCCHGDTKVHVVCLHTRSDDGTAECFRELCRSTGGRLHWIKESGLVESDDVKLIEDEIEKTIEFSRKCSTLVDSVRKKKP